MARPAQIHTGDLAQARIGLQRLKSKLRSPLVGSMSIFTVAMAVRLVLQVVVFGIVAGSMGRDAVWRLCQCGGASRHLQLVLGLGR